MWLLQVSVPSVTMTVVAPAPRPNSLLPRAPAPWRPAAAAALGLPAAVQSLLQQLGGTFHTYHPFRRTRNEGGEVDNNIPRSPAPLLLLTRNTLVASFGLRKLRRLLLWAGAPRAVSRLVSTVAASECESLGAAPLTDVFAQPFFHRAVTWRVTCCLDRQPYLTTYAATSAIHGYCVPWVSGLTACTYLLARLTVPSCNPKMTQSVVFLVPVFFTVPAPRSRKWAQWTLLQG